MNHFNKLIMSASFLLLIQSGTAYCMDTDIFQAAKDNKAARIQELIAADPCCIYRQDSNTHTPLHCAAENGCDDAIVTILKAVPAEKINEYINQKDVFGVTPLHLAAFHGYISTVPVLVNSGALVNAVDMHDETPLQEALRGFESTTNILVFSGVSPDTFLSSGHANYKMYKKYKETLLYLIEHGAKFDVKFHNSTSDYIKKLIQEIQEIIALPLMKERSKKIGMVLASSLHPRIGKESPLGMLPQDILYLIGSLVKESEKSEGIDKQPQDIQDTLYSIGLLVKKSEKVDKECKIAPQQVQKKKSKCLVM